LFGIFAKNGLPIVWPEPTHSKNPDKQASLFGNLEKWKPVKEVLDFEDEGVSIFTRDKPLSDKTLDRIYAGLIKFVANGDEAFISKYYSGKPEGKNITLEGPAGTVTCVDGQSLVKVAFMVDTQWSTRNGTAAKSLETPCQTLLASAPPPYVVRPISLLKYNSTDSKGKHTPPSIENPCPTIATQNRLGVIQGKFLIASNGGDPSAKVFSVDSPCRVITTSDNKGLVNPQFLQHYYGNGFCTSQNEPCPTITTKERTAFVNPEYLINYNHSSKSNDVNEPAPTLLTRDKLGLVHPKYFLYREFKTPTNSDINEPAGTITTVPKMNLVEAEPFIVNQNYSNGPKSIEEPCSTITANRKWHYIINPSWGGHPSGVDDPCVVLIARQDKSPLYLTMVDQGDVAIAIYDTDTPVMIKIKEFMAIYGLVDIKMRMLRVPELLKIQGFPVDYKMIGNQSDQKKFIGNSVVPHVVKNMALSLAVKLLNLHKGKRKWIEAQRKQGKYVDLSRFVKK
jgi:DNA (cytosine-5)-methyltransferase 1